MKSFIERFMEFVKSRIFLLLLGIFVMFSITSVRLFSLQIVNGEKYQQEQSVTIRHLQMEIQIPTNAREEVFKCIIKAVNEL